MVCDAADRELRSRNRNVAADEAGRDQVAAQCAHLIRLLHGLYAASFNDRHRRSGHLFQGRFGSTLQTSDEQLWHVVAYIARNPVEAGLCATPADWRWSSHAEMTTGSAPSWIDQDRLFESLVDVGGDPRRRYTELVG